METKPPYQEYQETAVSQPLPASNSYNTDYIITNKRGKEQGPLEVEKTKKITEKHRKS